MKEKIPRDSLEEGLKEDMYMDGWEGERRVKDAYDNGGETQGKGTHPQACPLRV